MQIGIWLDLFCIGQSALPFNYYASNFLLMLYKVHVEFNRDNIIINGNQISIGIKSKPIKGKANKEIIKKLALHFGVSPSQVIIRSGNKSRQKIVEVLI